MVFDNRYLTADRGPLRKSLISGILFGIAVGIIVCLVSKNTWLFGMIGAVWALATVYIGNMAEINRQKEALHSK